MDETKQANFIASFATENPLNYSEKNFLSKPFEPSEFRNAIKKRNPNSAPGPDGLSSNLYKSFSKLYSIILCNLLNNALDNGNLRQSFKLAILKLIPKIDNLVLPDDFRPISLINTDQIIVSHVFCERLKNNLEQDGNVPSRRHILGSKIFKEQLLEKFGKKFFFQKKILIFFRKKVFFRSHNAEKLIKKFMV